MRILVVGGGGREHALIWKIAQSRLVKRIFCTPGNAGISEYADCIPIPVNNLTELADFAEKNRIDLTVVGPEIPLVAGITDIFCARGLPIVGPSSEPARLEGSKSFAKEVMRDSGIPCADYETFTDLALAQDYVHRFFQRSGAEAGIVIKADGLAAGKGVTVAENEAQAQDALRRMMQDQVFGESGSTVVIEERLFGEEASIIAITDGQTVIPMLVSQDHKRIYEGDKGANTGGMGAYTPVPVIPPDIANICIDRIIKPAVAAVRQFGIPYQGFLYAGVIVTEEGPKCIEFNCRLGDPETQVILPMLESDIVPLLVGSVDCTLDKVKPVWRHGAAATIVAASEGYPGDYAVGKPIYGLEAALQAQHCHVFHAGTKKVDDTTVTAGGRVLSVTAVADDLVTAVANAYIGLGHIHFEGIYYRKDIAARVLTATL